VLFKKCFNPHNTIHLKLANELNLQKIKFYFTAAAISVARAIIANWLVIQITRIANNIILVFLTVQCKFTCRLSSVLV